MELFGSSSWRKMCIRDRVDFCFQIIRLPRSFRFTLLSVRISPAGFRYAHARKTAQITHLLTHLPNYPRPEPHRFRRKENELLVIVCIMPQISRITGMMSGRRDVVLLMNRL